MTGYRMKERRIVSEGPRYRTVHAIPPTPIAERLRGGDSTIFLPTMNHDTSFYRRVLNYTHTSSLQRGVGSASSAAQRYGMHNVNERRPRDAVSVMSAIVQVGHGNFTNEYIHLWSRYFAFRYFVTTAKSYSPSHQREEATSQGGGGMLPSSQVQDSEGLLGLQDPEGLLGLVWWLVSWGLPWASRNRPSILSCSSEFPEIHEKAPTKGGKYTGQDRAEYAGERVASVAWASVRDEK